MAHFAQLDGGNMVMRVSVVDNSVILDIIGKDNEHLGINYLKSIHGENTKWKQTSRSGRFRGNFASVGFEYDEENDVFMPPKPFRYWTLEKQNGSAYWKCPIEKPDETQEQIDSGYFYVWSDQIYEEDTSDPKTQGWILMNSEGEQLDPN